MSEELCDGKIVFLLEGGYDLTGLPEGVKESSHAGRREQLGENRPGLVRRTIR